MVGGLVRMIGIVLVFSILGPFAFAVLVLLIVAGLGAPLLQLFAAFVGLDALNTIISVALWVLTVAAMLAAFLPSAAAGLIFGFMAVVTGPQTHSGWRGSRRRPRSPASSCSAPWSFPANPPP